MTAIEKRFLAVIFTALMSTITYGLYGAEIKCKPVKYVEAWHEVLEMHVVAHMLECETPYGIIFTTKPEGTYPRRS